MVFELQSGHEIKLKQFKEGELSKLRKIELSFLYAVQFVSFRSTFLPSKIKIIQWVSELQSGHEIKFNHKKER